MGVELDYPLEYVLELCFCSLFILVGFGGDVAHGGILRIGVEQGICLESVSWLLVDRELRWQAPVSRESEPVVAVAPNCQSRKPC
jgi:hypothetical protein